MKRKPFNNNKGLASLITFVISALWHGFYPLYYLFFVQYYLIEQISNILDEKYHLFDKIAKQSILIKIPFYLVQQFFLEYVGLSFAILDFWLNWNYYIAFYFIPNIMLLVGFIILTYLTKHKRGHKTKNN